MAQQDKSRARRILRLVNHREAARVSRILRKETVGGALLVIAAIIAVTLANSPAADGYFALRDFRFGPESLHLNLSLGAWAADGLLAIFFFMVGLELKREFVEGDLRNPKTAVVPVAAAIGGVAVPAILFAAINWGQASVHGWAIPTATDIAFAVAVLAIIAPRLPPALRMFLLTLAVVDDLVAIGIIAVFYTSDLNFLLLIAAIVPIALYAVLANRFQNWFARSSWGAWLILLPLGVVAWALVHGSGIHATVAGVLLAFTVPVKRRDGATGPGLAEVMEHRFRPLSTGFAVPIFAFFASGVALTGGAAAFADPIAVGILVGLVLGKPIGIAGTTWLVTKFSRAELDESVTWRKLIGVAALGGIGFTVSLLVADLSFQDPADGDIARIAILSASVLAALVATVLLAEKPRARKRVTSA